MYNVWVSLLEAEACGYGPGLSDVKHMQLPKILAKNDVREHNEPLSQPIKPSYSRTRHCLPSSGARGVNC